jgi:hypothetical protein
MDNTLAIALSATGAGVLAPLLMSWLTNRHRQFEKKQDWERQDKVAAKAEESARLLLESNERIARITEETAKSQNGKLDQIHVLVNSAMTAEMEKGLASHKAILALLVRLAPEEVAQIDATKKLIAALETQLAERLKQTQAADLARKEDLKGETK